jgi:hypothetical protein
MEGHYHDEPYIAANVENRFFANWPAIFTQDALGRPP